MSNLSIAFDFSYYVTTPIDNKIIELSADHLKNKRVIVTVIIDGLDPGRQYSIDYTLINSGILPVGTEIFAPPREVFYASKTSQKFSTIAYVDSSELYIIQATVTRVGSVSSASDMVTLKCGNVNGCPTTPVIISSREYVRFDNRPVYIPSSRCDAQVNISANIYNAVRAKPYAYNFISAETDINNSIIFNPPSGTIIAGDTIQNVNTVAKFIGKSGYYCVKVIITDIYSEETLEDHLLIQCSTCT
jgi:hypothetical protein